MVVGRYESFDLGGGRSADLYLLRFGRDGQPLSPRTGRILADELARATDVFVVSHGWNNTFDDAAQNYRRFITGYIGQRAEFGLPTPSEYQPVMVGVIWPSTSFVLPWEEGPKIAGDATAEAARTEEMLRLVSAALKDEAASRLVELVDGRTGVGEDDARDTAEMLIDGLRGTDPDDASQPPTIDELLDAWAALDGASPEPADPDDFGEPTVANGAAPRTAGFPGVLDPRNLLRVATVWLMKDRSGKVGARGVGPLVQHVLSDTSARVHLVGHSFGCRVVLSSVAVAPTARSVRSMLLLQPAVNRWCFRRGSSLSNRAQIQGGASVMPDARPTAIGAR
jgi:pimeloyl-ACP methyl ester carboxylesterase